MSLLHQYLSSQYLSYLYRYLSGIDICRIFIDICRGIDICWPFTDICQGDICRAFIDIFRVDICQGDICRPFMGRATACTNRSIGR